MNTKINNEQEANDVMELCIGRLFKMGSRPSQEGDLETYEKIKWLFMDAAEHLGMETTFVDNNSYASNYYKMHHD